MSMKLSHELFAERGNPWNHPNYKFHVDSYRIKHDKDGTRVLQDVRRIDGYDDRTPRIPRHPTPIEAPIAPEAVAEGRRRAIERRNFRLGR